MTNLNLVLFLDPIYTFRLENFEKWMPQAETKYNAEGGLKCKYIRDEMKDARKEALVVALQRDAVQHAEKHYDYHDSKRIFQLCNNKKTSVQLHVKMSFCVTKCKSHINTFPFPSQHR